MELDVCIRGRRSIRKYLDRPVSRELVLKVMEAAQFAPSWKNSQVSRYYVVDTEEKRQQLLSCLPEFNQRNVENAPVLIVTCVVKERSGFERDGSYSTHLKEGVQYFDHGLQVENLCLKAWELGLGTLIIGLYDENAIRKLLQVPNAQEIVSVIGMGYPDVEPEMPNRKRVEDIVTFI